MNFVCLFAEISIVSKSRFVQRSSSGSVFVDESDAVTGWLIKIDT